MLLDLAATRPATLHTGRLICLDGPAGSGKTTLAAAITDLAPESSVVHLDDLLDGWEGLPHVAAPVEALLRSLAAGETGTYRRYDWAADRYGEQVRVAPTPLLVLEGCGSGSRVHADLATLTAWVWAPADERVRRGLAREGPDVQERWLEWMRAEEALFTREGTAARADVWVDGTGCAPPRIRPSTRGADRSSSG